MEKHYLASANTCNGFKNCFEYINMSNKAFTYILKGGPGTGKSTIIKKFGKEHQKKGGDVEYFYCSSDIDSLDGVNITKKHIAIVDGTAPHVTEATIPGVKEKILNVGAFIKDDIKINKKIIEKYLSKKSFCYALANSYLKTAGELFKVEQLLSYKTSQNKNTNFIELLNIKKQTAFGGERKLFASFVTPKGIEFIYNKNKYQNKLILNNSLFENFNHLQNLKTILLNNNYNIICFLSIFDPSLIESIYIEELKTLVLAFNPDKNIFDNFKNKNILEKLIKAAGANIANAKYNHKKIENYYIKAMDFNGLSKFINHNIFNNKT